MVNETVLLLTMVRREHFALQGEERPLEDYFPTSSPRSERFKAMKRAMKTEVGR